jgi:hypothetical protein
MAIEGVHITAQLQLSAGCATRYSAPPLKLNVRRLAGQPKGVGCDR